MKYYFLPCVTIILCLSMGCSSGGDTGNRPTAQEKKKNIGTVKKTAHPPGGRDAQGRTHGVFTESYAFDHRYTKRRYEFSHGKKHGTWTTRHTNGKKESQQQWKEDKKHGIWETWDAEGNPLTREEWQEDKKHGAWTGWYKSSYGDRKKYRRTWVNGIQQDIWLEWHDNRNIKSRTQWLHGNIEGAPMTFDRRGRLEPVSKDKEIYYDKEGLKEKEIEYFTDDRPPRYTLFHPSGGKSASGSYDENKKRHGPWTGWNETGGIVFTGQYQQGKPHGEWAAWHEKGNKKYTGTYHEGKKTGLWKTWHYNGKKESQKELELDQPVGQWLEWYDSGILKTRKDYDDESRLHGQWLEFDSQGTPLLAEEWSHGEKKQTLWAEIPSVKTAGTSPYRLSPLPSPTPAPFTDVNDTYLIETQGKELHFYSINGKRFFHPDTGAWTVSISPGVHKQQAEKAKALRENPYEKNRPPLPAWYKKTRGYIFHESQVLHYKAPGSHFVLSPIYNEGSEKEYDELTSLSSRETWRVPPGETHALFMQPPFAWLGKNRGITRMDSRNLKLTRFTVLPSYKKRLQWCDFQGKRYITTDEPFIQVLEPETGALSILTPPETIYRICRFSPKRDGNSDPFWERTPFPEQGLFLSNPVIREGWLYVSIFRVNGGEYYSYGRNLLLKYHIDTGKWWFYNLGMRVTRLEWIKERLWLITSWEDSYEGGDGTLHGNIAFMDAGGALHRFPRLKREGPLGDPMDIQVSGVEPIRAHVRDEDAIYFLSQYVIHPDYSVAGKGAIIKVTGKDYKTLEIMEPLFDYPDDGSENRTVREPLRKLYQRFDPFLYETTDRTRKEVQDWKVRPTLLETGEGKGEKST